MSVNGVNRFATIETRRMAREAREAALGLSSAGQTIKPSRIHKTATGIIDYIAPMPSRMRASEIVVELLNRPKEYLASMTKLLIDA